MKKILSMALAALLALSLAGSALAEELTGIDLNTITPLEALNLLYKLKKMAENG